MLFLSYFPFYSLLVIIGVLYFFFVNLILMHLPFILCIIHQFHTYLWHSYYVPGTVLGIDETVQETANTYCKN